LALRRVEGLEQAGELRAEVGAVFGGAFFYPGTEGVGGLENAGVFGKEAEQEAHEQQFERVAGVVGFLERVVQLAHALGGFDVDGVLRGDGLRAVTGDEGEIFDVLVQVGEREFVLRAGFEVVEAEAGEVGDQHESGQVAFLDAGEVIEGLGVGAVEIFAARFVLDEERTFPEEVDVTLLVAELFDGFFKAGDALAVDAEDVEEFGPEGFGFGVFGGLKLPAFGELVGAVTDFVPA